MLQYNAKKCLYLICPTDCIESIINRAYKCENYFYTSLGNSFVFDSKTINELYQIIEKHCITDICFVLSNNNKIIIDALGNQCYSNLNGLNNFYNEITKQKVRSEITSQNNNRKFLLISYYLNNKICELQLLLNALSNKPYISGKIYSSCQNIFLDIYSNLVCLDKHHLN